MISKTVSSSHMLFICIQQHVGRSVLPCIAVSDFPQRLTAYLDLNLNKCYVIPLNTSIVMPPKDFLELLINIKVIISNQVNRLRFV